MSTLNWGRESMILKLLRLYRFFERQRLSLLQFLLLNWSLIIIRLIISSGFLSNSCCTYRCSACKTIRVDECVVRIPEISCAVSIRAFVCELAFTFFLKVLASLSFEIVIRDIHQP